MSHAQILVVEDEALVAKGIQTELRNLGYSVPTTAATGEEAIAKAEQHRPDLVLMDVVLKGDLDGVETAEKITERLDIPVIYLTAYQDDETLGRAKLTQPFGYLLKPYEEQDLRTTIEVALHKHRMEQQLKETERWLAATLLSIADAVVATDSELRIRLMNPAAEALTGWAGPDALGKDLAEVCATSAPDWPGELETLTAAALHDQRSVRVFADAPLVTRQGRRVPVEGTLAPIADDKGNLCGVVLVLRDVTARTQLEKMRAQNEEQRRHAEKMDAVSRLAGGIAHDFNNLLTAIVGNVSLARSALPEKHFSCDPLLAAEAAAARAAREVEQLMGVSGHAFLHMKPLHLGDCLHDVQRVLRHAAPDHIGVEVRVADDLWTVQADPVQVREALLNLAQTPQAVWASGRVTLEAANCVVTEEQAATRAEARPGEYVCLRIVDTARGIPPELGSRIFDPFAAPPEAGRAGGLGPALAFGVIKQHFGWIEWTSALDRGTTFEVYLPRYADPLVPPPAPVPITPAQRNSTTTILLADDEPMLRELGRTILEGAGYQVLLAEDGALAVDAFRRDRHLIDLVILDLTMPRLSGVDACRQLLAIDPGVRVLFSSGYFADELAESEDRVLGMLKKPYSHEQLLHAVQAALEQAVVPKRDVLLMLVKRLEQALAAPYEGRESAWLERAMLVLDRVEQALRQQLLNGLDPADDDDGVPVTEPARARRLEELRRHYAAFVEQAIDLKRALQEQVQGRRTQADAYFAASGAGAGGLGSRGYAVDTLRRQLEQFRAELGTRRLEEINIVLESVTTEIGAGD